MKRYLSPAVAASRRPPTRAPKRAHEVISIAAQAIDADDVLMILDALIQANVDRDINATLTRARADVEDRVNEIKYDDLLETIETFVAPVLTVRRKLS